jgi:tetratricopeptide (TPR) repeat protein
MKELEGRNFGIDTTIIPRTLIWRAIFQLRLGQVVDANNDLQQASKILGTLNSAGIQTKYEYATIQLQQGHIAFDLNLDEAQHHYENSLALFREAMDIRGSADALMVLGWANWHRGAYETANTLFEESHALRCSLGDKRRIIESQSGLGFLAMFQGNFEKAEQLILESHMLLEEIGIQVNLIYDFPSNTDPTVIIDNEHETITQYRKSVGLYSDLGFRYCLVPVHSIHGYIQKHLGQYNQASSMGKMGFNLASKIGWKQEMGLCLELLGDIAIVKGQFIQAEDYIKSCISIYQETKQIDISSAFASLGYIAIGSGQYAQAQTYLANSLRKATEVQAQYPITHAIPAIALLFAAQGETEQAVELYAFAKRYQRVANSRWFEDVVGKKISSVANRLPLEIFTAAKKRGIKRDLQTTVSELLFELESSQRFGLMSV